MKEKILKNCRIIDPSQNIDEVGNIVYSLRDKITEIDKIVADEASRISSFKSSKS